jgi:hypothetical protein
MPDQQRICDLLMRWEEAKAGGKRLSAEELCPDQPELAQALKFRIEKLEAVDRMLGGEAEAATAVTLAGPPLSDLGIELPTAALA